MLHPPENIGDYTIEDWLTTNSILGKCGVNAVESNSKDLRVSRCGNVFLKQVTPLETNDKWIQLHKPLLREDKRISSFV